MLDIAEAINDLRAIGKKNPTDAEIGEIGEAVREMHGDKAADDVMLIILSGTDRFINAIAVAAKAQSHR